MKRIAAIIITVCMAVTGTCTGIPQMMFGGEDMEVSAASYPALKAITYQPTGNQRKDVIGFAKTQIGYKEGSNNNTYFGSWFGSNYNPWCAMFVSWSAAKAGVPKSVVPRQATADRSWAKKQGVYHKSKQWGGSYTPKKGDLIYFSWSVRDWADHIGMVTGTHKEGGKTYVDTVEGNKRDKVVEASYLLSNRYILGYASPKYTTGSVPEDPQITTPTEPAVPTGDTYKLKYRDGLDETDNDEEDEIIPPTTGGIGTELTLSTTKFKRTGYTYSKWDVYREKSGKLLYLSRDTETGTEEAWTAKDEIPEGYAQVYVKCGESLLIVQKITGTVYVSPVWKKKTYKITYDANGGTGAPAEQKKTYNKDLTLTTDKPTRSGYDFAGWASSSTAEKAEYKSGDTYKKNAKMTLYAVWDVAAYDAKATKKITSRSGPGSSYDKVSTIKDGAKITIRKISNGWGQLSDKSWVPIKYTMKLNVKEYQLNYVDGNSKTTNDSSIISPETVKYGKSVTTSTLQFSKEGHHYDKWQLYYKLNGKAVYLCKNKDSGEEEWHADNKIPDTAKKVKVKTGDSVTINSSVGEQVYITPIWDKDTYKIKFKANGGKKAPKAQSKVYGESLKLTKSKPTKKGAKFLGWSTNKNAAKPQYKAGAKYKDNQPATLYAVWKSTWFKVKLTDEANKRKGPGTDYDVVGSLPKGKTVTIVKKKNGWGKLKNGSWISLSLTKKLGGSKKSSSKTDEEETTTTEAVTDETTTTEATAGGIFTVKITAKEGMNTRYGPSKKYDVANSYQYDEELRIDKVQDGWGKLADEDSEQWLLLEYTEITDGYKVKIESENINQRSGPSFDDEVVDTFDPGTYTITKINGDWGLVESTDTWVCLEYTERVN